jgi:hypothetical protein
VLTSLKGLSFTDAHQYIQHNIDTWGHVKTQLALSALSDLISNVNMQSLPLAVPAMKPNISRSFLINHGLAYYSF